jgi:hypothetical protein
MAGYSSDANHHLSARRKFCPDVLVVLVIGAPAVVVNVNVARS